MPSRLTLVSKRGSLAATNATAAAQYREEPAMSKKFDPAPADKYSEPRSEAIKRDLEFDAKLKSRLVGGSFPASDPASASQPFPSKYDKDEG